MTNLVQIEQGSDLVVFSQNIDDVIRQVRDSVCLNSGDISDKKTRDEIKSHAFKVTKSKTYIAGKIDELIKQKQAEIEPITAIINMLKENKKRSNAELSELAKEARQVVTDYEDRQKELAAIDVARVEAENLAQEVEAAHELALFMDAAHDKEKADEVARIAKEQDARDEKIKAEAVAKALRAAEAKAVAEANKLKFERAEAEKAALQAEADKKAAIEAAKQVKIDAQLEKERNEKAKIEAEFLAIETAKAAAEKARQDEVERQRIAELSAKKEAEQRAKDRAHASNVMGEAKLALIGLSLDEQVARKVVLAIKAGAIPHVSIKF